MNCQELKINRLSIIKNTNRFMILYGDYLTFIILQIPYDIRQNNLIYGLLEKSININRDYFRSGKLLQH